MGSRGTVAKANSTREDRNRVSVQQNLGLTFVPDPDPRWLESTAEDWDTFIVSDVAKALTDVDGPALFRLFGYRDAWTRASNEFMKRVFEQGDAIALIQLNTKGDEKVAAVLLVMERLEKLMLPLESRFGISPMERARLGITVGQAQVTATNVNALPGRGEREQVESTSDNEVTDAEIVEM